VSSRIEGFEKYVESFFGPNGEYSKEKVNEKVDQVKQYLRIKRDGRAGLKEQIINKGSTLFKEGKQPKVRSFNFRSIGNNFFMTLRCLSE